MIVITGATGNTGTPAAEALLAKGEILRVIGRDAAKLQTFSSRGAEVFVGNVEDASEMERAFAGATSAYLLIPQALQREDFRDYQERVSDAYVSAISNSGVKFAVTLSSIGAQNTEKTGPILGLHNMEEKLNRVPGLNVLHLRPATFMENLLMSIDGIRMMNVLPGAFAADAPFPTIATKDVGDYAARRLSKRDFSGHSTQELLGPRDVTMKETAAIIGRAMGKPNLAYVQMPLPLMESALASMGMPKTSAALLVELWNAGNNGMLDPQETRSTENTTLTTLEQFAEEIFAPQFLRRAAKA
ncbi:MAG TPA: NmrA family NAD(P)-binding protein [Candidatus Acidoferrales bacterium]|nr:NmrA family NAD(P)-binding protein [Candidatus Acidoferrales bacterium]